MYFISENVYNLFSIRATLQILHFMGCEKLSPLQIQNITLKDFVTFKSCEGVAVVD